MTRKRENAVPLFGPYARLFAVPGARAFSLAGAVARLPLSTVGLGAVLLVAGETGSYGLAGAVAGSMALAGAAASPAWARLMDRRGQGAVLRPAMLAFVTLGLSFVTVVVADGPRWSWFALAALTGLAWPNVGAVVRARWAHALDDADQRQTAFAYESVIDEVVFVVGPPLVTFLAALVAPPAGFLTGLLVGVGGGLVLARLSETEPPVHPRAAGAHRRASSALTPALLVVAVTYLAVGVVFGAMDVVVVGFAEAEGAPVVAGAALAAYAGGSLVAGLVYGAVRLPGTLAARFLCCALFFALAAQVLLTVGSLPALVPAAALAGLAIAPVLVSGTSLVESRVPRAVLTEGLAWTMTGLTLGVTLGAAVAGAAVDAWGAETAFVVPALGAGLAGLLAVFGSPLLSAPAAPIAPARAGQSAAGQPL